MPNQEDKLTEMLRESRFTRKKVENIPDLDNLNLDASIFAMEVPAKVINRLRKEERVDWSRLLS